MTLVGATEVDKVSRLVLELLDIKFEGSYLQDDAYKIGYIESLLTKVQQKCQAKILKDIDGNDVEAGTLLNQSDTEDFGRQDESVKDENQNQDDCTPPEQNLPEVSVLATLLGLEEKSPDFSVERNALVVIGRSKNADILLDSAKVSRKHAQISSNSDRMFIKVLSRINGVTLNNKMVGPECGNEVVMLHQGDEIKIADERWKVDYIRETFVEKPSAHELYDYNFEIKRENRRKRGKEPFKSVLPAARNSKSGKHRSPSATGVVVRHGSKDRLNARNRDLYAEQSVHLERGDEIDKRTSKLDLKNLASNFDVLMTPEDFHRPLFSSSPSPNSPFGFNERTTDRVSLSSDCDVVIEKEVYV